jgi:hypothetical protein
MNSPGLRRTTLLTSVLGALGLAGCSSTPVVTATVGPPWTGESFLPNYAELRPVPTATGHDYVYVAPNLAARLSTFTKQVMIDQPEVFISPQSPYGGAKPSDLAGIAEFVRSRFGDALTARGYQVVDNNGPGIVYTRLAITDLSLQTKSRNILAYTPIGFVVSSAVRAGEEFLQKMDILDVALQGEFLDGGTGAELAAGVVTRGGNGSTLSYGDFEQLVDEYSARFACRLDNARLPPAQSIDCSSAAARKARAPF